MTKSKNSKTQIIFQIVLTFLMFISVFVLLSIVSFNEQDAKLIENSSLEIAKNLLGKYGAIVANFFILNTFGYFSIAFPIFLFVLSFGIFLDLNKSKIFIFSNYLFLFAILFSSYVAVLNRMWKLTNSIFWTGIIGEFISNTSTEYVGNFGAFSIFSFLIFVLLVLLFRLNLKEIFINIIESCKKFFLYIKEKFKKEKTVNINFNNDEYEKYDEDNDNEINSVEKEEKKEIDIKPTIVEIKSGEKKESKIPKKKKEEKIVTELLEGIEPSDKIPYELPPIDLLESLKKVEEINTDELNSNAELVREKLLNFGVEIEKVSVTPGPVVTLYELTPAQDVKISRIVALQDDLQLALAAKGIRIIAPIPGKNTVGVEIPNKNPETVQLRSIINSNRFQTSKSILPLAIGKTISGDIFVDDLSKMPHLLVAGATGSGKSVGINNIIMSLLYRLYPHELKFVIVDPKKIEMSLYSKLRHHYLAVSPDINEDIVTHANNAAFVLKSLTIEMDSRYDLLADAGVRNILDYNAKLDLGKIQNKEDKPEIKHRHLPYIVVVIDELADLMLTAGREVEPPIARLAQMSRAVGIHLVIATQRPSVDVITGVIKANFPARIAYQVATKIDSRTIIDINGAEQLIGQGDMLYLPGNSPKPMRMQNAFVSTDEVEKVTKYIFSQPGYSKPYLLPSSFEKKTGYGTNGSELFEDEFLVEAAHIVVQLKQASVSLLQRKLSIGYARAGKIIDTLEQVGIVGPHTGSKARDVLIDTKEELTRILESYNIR